MSVAGIMLVAALLAIVVLAWPRPADRGPAPVTRGGTKLRGAPYRSAAGEGDDEAQPLGGSGLQIDPSARERDLAVELAQTYASAAPVRDGRALVDAAKALLAVTRAPALRAHALALLAYGHVLRGAEAAALSALEAIPLDHPPDATLELAVLRGARCYQRALIRARQAVAEDDSEHARRDLREVEEESRAWDVAVAHLAAPERDDALSGAEYALVREAGRLNGRSDAAARIGEGLFERAPDPDLAFEIARCWARAGEAEATAYWLRRAAAAGLCDRERVAATREIAELGSAAVVAAVEALHTSG